MKKILIIVLAVFLLSIILTACGGIDMTNYGHWSKFCKDNNDFPAHFNNHGQCVSYFAQDDAAKAAQACKEFENWGFENHGQCQQWLKDNLP